MRDTGDVGSRPLSNTDLARVLSPLLFFVAHVLYLAFWSPEPFLRKWIDGSFSFFLALVLCNIIRARVVAAHAGGDDNAEAPVDPGAGPAQEAEDPRAGDGHAAH